MYATAQTRRTERGRLDKSRAARARPFTPRNERRPLNLIFSYIHPAKPQRTLGPLSAIWLNSDGMRVEPHGRLRAPYRDHQWDLDGLVYFRLDCTARVSVHFERSESVSKQYGPYSHFSAVNGLAYGDDRVIAFLDLTINEWFFYDTGYHWPIMVVSEALGAT